jgi:Synergist-CTERM protein sorting domain-containing protein
LEKDGIGYPKLNVGFGSAIITIHTQPQANTTVTEGNITGSLSVSASVTHGATLAYQWYSNATEISGATNANFVIPATLTATGSPYYYYCVVSAVNAVSVASSVATVTVNPVPVPVITIDSHPANATFTEGSISGSLSVSASVTHGATLAYQWYSNTTNSNVGGTPISGATGTSFAILSTLTAADSPYYYYCVVSATGAESVASGVATVTVNSVNVTGVTVSPKSANLVIGETSTIALTAIVTPDNAANKDVEWDIDNPSVASVNHLGFVTALTVGKAKITVTTIDGKFTDTCEIEVSSVLSGDVLVEKITLSPPSATIKVGVPFTLTAGIEPTNASNQNVAWSSNNNAIATVSVGIVTGVSEGTATITVSATDASGASATCTITVVPNVVSADPTFPSNKGEVANETGINSGDLEERDGKVYLSKKRAEEIAKKLLDEENVEVNVLPVFRADVVPDGGVAEIVFTMTGKELLALFPDEIELIGLTLNGSGKLFDYVNNANDFGDGKFTLRLGGVIYEGEINPNATYELVVLIKDGGTFDLDGVKNGKIISSVFLAAKKGGSGGGGGGSGGGGGCNVMGFGYLALAAVPLVFRKKR